MMTTKSLELLS